MAIEVLKSNRVEAQPPWRFFSWLQCSGWTVYEKVMEGWGSSSVRSTREMYGSRDEVQSYLHMMLAWSPVFGIGRYD
jgi:hypothetical protein